jgi:hypothetical protein
MYGCNALHVTRNGVVQDAERDDVPDLLPDSVLLL